MPDRTQMLLVEIDAAFAQVLATPDRERDLLYTPADQMVAREEFAAAVEKARAALSQPEHRGEEKEAARKR